MFGFCITHILNTERAKIWKKKIRRQKVKGFDCYLGCVMSKVGMIINYEVEVFLKVAIVS